MFKFLKQLIKNPQFIGSVAPNSEYLAKKMIEGINFQECNSIIEYGSGIGVFTEKLIVRKKEDTLLLVFENNKKIYEDLFSM